MKNFLFIILVLLLSSQAAHAGPDRKLSPKDVERFVESMHDFNEFSAGMEKEGNSQALQDSVVAGAYAGNLSPYTNSVNVLRSRYPYEHAKLGGMVKKYGFSSTESWAETGDAVMAAYATLKNGGNTPQAVAVLEKMTSEMEAKKLTPESRAALAYIKEAAKIYASVPPENQDAVRPYIGVIDAWTQATP